MNKATYFSLCAARDLLCVITAPAWIPLLLVVGFLATLAMAFVDWFEQVERDWKSREQHHE